MTMVINIVSDNLFNQLKMTCQFMFKTTMCNVHMDK